MEKLFTNKDRAQTIYRVTGMHPIAYNDRPERTKEDVLSMLEYITHLF